MTKLQVKIDAPQCASTQIVTVGWTWPQDGGLTIRSIKDQFGREIEVNEYTKQIIYQEIYDSLEY